MGREIRRVPADWQHPKDDRGRFVPLYNQPYEDAAEQWMEGLRAWERGERPVDCETKYFWDWEGRPPDHESYRPSWPEGADTHFQMYETVSEGTPLSPPLPSLDALAEWLAANTDFWGLGPVSIENARRFCKMGWAPSMVVTPSGASGIGLAVIDAFPDEGM